MTQITLNTEDKTMIPGLRKILSNLKGVSIVRTKKIRKGTLQTAIDEVRKGQLTRVGSVDELMKELES